MPFKNARANFDSTYNVISVNEHSSLCVLNDYVKVKGK